MVVVLAAVLAGARATGEEPRSERTQRRVEEAAIHSVVALNAMAAAGGALAREITADPTLGDAAAVRRAREATERAKRGSGTFVTVQTLHRLKASGLPPAEWAEHERGRGHALGLVITRLIRSGREDLLDVASGQIRDGEEPSDILARLDAGRWP